MASAAKNSALSKAARRPKKVAGTANRSAAARDQPDDEGPAAGQVAEMPGGEAAGEEATDLETADGETTDGEAPEEEAAAAQVVGEDPNGSNSQEQPGETVHKHTGADRRTVLTRVLLAVLVVSVLVAGGFGIALYALANGASTGNAAVADTAATKEVTARVSEAVRTSFTYDYGNPQSTEQEASKVLTGPAIQQYRQLFGQVKQVAPAQKLVFTSTVRTAGVQELRGDTARVLLFVDQQGVRADNNQRRSGSAQLDVTAQRVGNAWKVSDIKVL